MKNFDTYFHENFRKFVQPNMSLAKSQMEYFELNKDFDFVKTESIGNV